MATVSDTYRVDYDLTRLGPLDFEEMCRALFEKTLGPTVTHFGDGPDGGREATFTGRVSQAGIEWDGYVVLQAKFLRRLRGTASDQSRLIKTVRAELNRWADPKSGRRKQKTVPDYLVIATNVVLTGAAGGGKERLETELTHLTGAADIKHALVWDYDKICSMLDDAPGIRRAYFGLITPGDVLARLHDYLEGSAAKLGEALSLHASQALTGDRYVRLTEAGGTGRLTLEQVGVDLPLTETPGFGAASNGAVAQLVSLGNKHLDLKRRERNTPNVVVLVGGPGQGKTTLSHFLAQAYRVALLGDPDSVGPHVAPVLAATRLLLEDQSIPEPQKRRWPIRINLADGLSGSLISKVALRVNESATTPVRAADMKSWFSQWPWLVILDGFDEVASKADREQVQDSVRNLLIEADSINSDVMVVITTRPQGYDREFELAGVRHLELKPFDKDEALTYATKFADVYFEDDRSQRRDVLAKLHRSSDDPQTSRLMVSPLQVTIMTLLIESYGHAPSWRHRLFDAYFETIYKREAARLKTHGRLLDERMADVIYLHEWVGLELQKTTEGSDAADAVMSRERLQTQAATRLVEQHGYELNEANDVAHRLVHLAMNRLVLLVPHQDGLGFEVRSLQEYMAARALTNGRDEVVLRRLALAAPSAHWRNAWLLAFARALETKPYLREQLMGSVRSAAADPLAKRVGLGPELAHDLLADAIGVDSPRTRAELIDTLLEVVDMPPRPFSVTNLLIQLSSEKELYKKTILDRFRRAVTEDPMRQAAAWSIMQPMHDGAGVLPSTARALQAQISLKSKPEQELALRALSGERVDPARLDVAPRSLSSFMSSALTALESDDDDWELEGFLTTMDERTMNVCAGAPDVALPMGAGTLMEAIHDAPYPRQPDAQTAMSQAIDSIEPSSWAASMEIRNALWRALRRQPVASEIDSPPA